MHRPYERWMTTEANENVARLKFGWFDIYLCLVVKLLMFVFQVNKSGVDLLVYDLVWCMNLVKDDALIVSVLPSNNSDTSLNEK